MWTRKDIQDACDGDKWVKPAAEGGLARIWIEIGWAEEVVKADAEFESLWQGRGSNPISLGECREEYAE